MPKRVKIQKGKLEKTSASIWMGIVSFAVITAMFATTAYAWASDSISNKGSKITAGEYAVSIMAVKDINSTVDDTNVIARPDDPENDGVQWINSMDINIGKDTFNVDGNSEFYLSVSAFANSTLDFKYHVQLSSDDASAYSIDKIEKCTPDGTSLETVTEIKNEKVSISTAPTADVYKITVKNNSQTTGTVATLRLSMQTANANQEILPIKSINELTELKIAGIDIPANALLYLANDIGDTITVADNANLDYDLVLKKLGTIDLNGHTLNVKSLKVQSEAVGIVTVSNGKLIIAGEQVTDTEKIEIVEGSALVTIKVHDLVPPEPIVPPEVTTTTPEQTTTVAVTEETTTGVPTTEKPTTKEPTTEISTTTKVETTTAPELTDAPDINGSTEP